MPDKKPRRRAKKSRSRNRFGLTVDSHGVARLEDNPQIRSMAVPRLSDIARSIAALVKPTQASQAGGVSPLAKISNTVGNTVLGYEPARGRPPAKKRKMASPPKAAPKRRSAAPTKSRRRPARRSAKVY